MDAGYELPLPAARILEQLNVRQRIPLSTWSLTVTSVALVERPNLLPAIALTVEARTTGSESGERWAVQFVVPTVSLQPGAGAPSLLLFLKVRLEEWWLNRASRPTTDARRLD